MKLNFQKKLTECVEYTFSVSLGVPSGFLETDTARSNRCPHSSPAIGQFDALVVRKISVDMCEDCSYF